jgi:hypothetical protein
MLLDNEGNVNAERGPRDSALNADVAKYNEAVFSVLLSRGADITV